MRRISRAQPRAAAPLAAALVVLSIVVVAVKFGDAPRYPQTGAKSAHEFVAANAGPDDVVLMLGNAAFTSRGRSCCVQ